MWRNNRSETEPKTRGFFSSSQLIYIDVAYRSETTNSNDLYAIEAHRSNVKFRTKYNNNDHLADMKAKRAFLYHYGSLSICGAELTHFFIGCKFLFELMDAL